MYLYAWENDVIVPFPLKSQLDAIIWKMLHYQKPLTVLHGSAGYVDYSTPRNLHVGMSCTTVSKTPLIFQPRRILIEYWRTYQFRKTMPLLYSVYTSSVDKTRFKYRPHRSQTAYTSSNFVSRPDESTCTWQYSTLVVTRYIKQTFRSLPTTNLPTSIEPRSILDSIVRHHTASSTQRSHQVAMYSFDSPHFIEYHDIIWYIFSVTMSEVLVQKV